MRFIDTTTQKNQKERNISDEDSDVPPLSGTNLT